MILSLTLVLINTIMYAKKHQKKDANLEKSYLVPKKVKTDNKKVYPIVIIMDLLLVILTLAFISWDLFEVQLFDDLTNELISPTGSTFMKGLFGGINTVLGITIDATRGTSNAFGHWSLMEAALAVFVASGALAFAYRKSFNGFINATGEGVKKALRPALLVGIAYIVLVCAVTVPFEFSILKNIIDVSSGFNLFVMCIVAIVFCFFTVESYYGVATAGTYLTVSSVMTNNVGIIALIWQSMYGLTMLVAPTSVILLATLAYTDTSYSTWFKTIWKLLLELFALILIILLIYNGVM